MSVAWITGARGFIGSALARHLSGRDVAVYGIGHGHWADKDAKAAGIDFWLNADVSVADLETLARNAPTPDTIYHLAGGSSVGSSILNPRGDFQKTVDATSELLEWTRLEAPGARIVALSSAAVYGAGHTGPIAETAVVSPYSPYGFHKYMMENLCRSYARQFGLRVAVARAFSVYGPGLRKQLLWDLFNRLGDGRDAVEFGGSGAELRDWLHIGDLVQALPIVAGIADEDAPVVNTGRGIGTPVRTVVDLAMQAWVDAGRDAPVAQFTGQSRRGDPDSLIADISRAQELGISADFAIEEGIREYLAWYLDDAGS